MRKRSAKNVKAVIVFAVAGLLALALLCVGAVLCAGQSKNDMPVAGAAQQLAGTSQSQSESASQLAVWPSKDALSSSVGMQEPATLKAYNLPDGFVYVDDVIPSAVMEIRYATSHNFMGVPIEGYDQPLAILTTQAASALAVAATRAAQDGWRLRIYDAYRPQQALDAISAWELSGDTVGKTEFYPNLEKAALFTDGYLSKYSRHTRGSTVDVTLEHATSGALVDMGGTYDLLDPVSNYGAAGLTQLQHDNREYLRALMDEAGFDSIATEWWHFQLREEPHPKTYFDFPVQ